MAFDKWTELRNAVQSYVDCGEIQFLPLLDKMDAIEAEEARQKPPAPTLKTGDKVRHKKEPAYGTGIVKEISKSGKRLYVDFAEINDWDRKKLLWTPRGYFAPEAFDLVEEAPQS